MVSELRNDFEINGADGAFYLFPKAPWGTGTEFVTEAIKNNPTRFAGLAALPIQAPDKAAEELEHRVRQQGFKGANINGHTRGRYLDDKFFSPILERAL